MILYKVIRYILDWLEVTRTNIVKKKKKKTGSEEKTLLVSVNKV